MLVGDARVSTPTQDATAQIRALKTAGCEAIFAETSSGAKATRSELEKLFNHLRKIDVLMVWKSRPARALAF